MIEEGKVVLPGEKLAISEELRAGRGTYESDGDIIAAVTGKFIFDRKTMAAFVEPSTTTPLLLRRGDIAVCEVKQITDSMVIVDILHIAGKKRHIAGDNDAVLHVSNISNDYVESTHQKFRIGDIMRAKIIEAEPSVRLSTKEKNLGVIKAYCTVCRLPLEKKGNQLECPVCGRTEDRRMAADYAQGNIDGGI